MDYKEKYEAALEVMSQWVAPCHTKEQLDVLKKSVFPELRESEDERIRKELVAFFIEVRNREGNEGYWHDLKVANILAYLEKQKDAITDVTRTEAYKMGHS